MHATYIGSLAEDAVVEFLKYNEYDVIAKNWKTKTCEIDIIAYKNQTIHFVEVKSRQNNHQGTGFAYITASKLRRMEYAAQLWICSNNWYGDFVLSAASVSGTDFEVNFLKQI